MNLENSIKDVIAKKLEDGTVEKLVSEQLESGVNAALKDLFGNYGDVTKIIKEKVKSVIVPYLEAYDYSEYVTKLDSVLTDVLKNSTLENKKLLENFKDLMSDKQMPKVINLSEIYSKWCGYCKENIDEDDAESVDYEKYIECNLNAEDISSDWSSYEKFMVSFTCEQDEDLNVEFIISHWKKDDKEEYSLDWSKQCDISSLRYLNKFEIFMMQLDQARTKIILDKGSSSDDIQLDEE